MSSKKTPNLGLHEWVPDDYVQMEEFNDNFKKLDDHAKQTENQMGGIRSEVTELKSDITQIDQTVTQNHNEVMSQLAETNEQLAQTQQQKADKNEVRKNNVPIGLNDVSPDLLAAIEGGEGTSFDLLSVPRAYSVSHQKTNFLQIGSTNLVDKNNVIEGFRIDPENNMIEDATWSITPFFPVEPNTTYQFNKVRRIHYYTEEKSESFISSHSGVDVTPWESTSPQEAAWARLTIRKSLLSVAQMNEGAELLPYEEFYIENKKNFKFNGEDIKDESIPPSKIKGEIGSGKTVYITVPNESISYFGIEGNGESDDTQGLRDYLYHLKEMGGGKLFLPNGIYKITGTLHVPKNTIIEGAGYSTQFILGEDFDLDSRPFRGDLLSHPYIVNEEGAENVFYKNFVVIGNKNQPINQRHHGVAFIDCLNGGAFNVSTEYINYFPTEAKTFGAMAYGLGVIRSKKIDIIGGRYTYGGYENIGLEFSEDVVIDRVFSGTGWRTSLQIHQGNKNVKITNSTIRQDDIYAHAGVTYHGRGAGGENDNIVFHNNTVDTISNGGGAAYMGNIQLIGPHKQVKFTNNIIRGKKNGIYNYDEAELMVVNSNIINCENGVGIRINGTSLVSDNYVNSANGTNFESTEDSIVKGSGNIGFDIPS